VISSVRDIKCRKIYWLLRLKDLGRVWQHKKSTIQPIVITRSGASSLRTGQNPHSSHSGVCEDFMPEPRIINDIT
jgi:hypothetical protein